MYRVPKQSASVADQGRVLTHVPNIRGRGRPRIYHVETLPVSFRVPRKWRHLGSLKAQEGKINLTKLFAIYYWEFLERSIEETQRFINDWERENGPISEEYV